MTAAVFGSEPEGLRLDQLRQHLNDRYGVELARPYDRDHRAAMTVSRWHSVSDVIVAVEVDEATGLFRLTAYTAVAWAEYADPFMCTERDAVQRAAAWCLQYVPETPCT